MALLLYQASSFVHDDEGVKVEVADEEVGAAAMEKLLADINSNQGRIDGEGERKAAAQCAPRY